MTVSGYMLVMNKVINKIFFLQVIFFLDTQLINSMDFVGFIPKMYICLKPKDTQTKL